MSCSVLVLLFAVFIVATACSLVGAVVRRFAAAGGAVVPPRADRWHTAPTPTMGGIAIAVATFVGSAAIGPAVGPFSRDQRWNGFRVPLGALAMFVVGLFDDRLQLSPVAKLVASLALGAFLVFALAGVELDGALPRLHAHRHDLVCRHVPCGEPARQHGRPCCGGGADRRRVHCRHCWRLARRRAGHSADGAGRGAGWVSVLEPTSGVACSWATAAACSSARILGAASLVPILPRAACLCQPVGRLCSS